MDRYFPKAVSFREKYRNPFRVDSKRGCYFAYTSRGTLTFFDNSFPEYGGDCFKVVMMVQGIGFRKALEHINEQFNLGLKVSSNSSLTPYREDYIKRKQRKIKKLPEEIAVMAKREELKTKKFHYKIEVRPWEQIDYDYWTKKYGISLNLLDRYKVFPVDRYFKRKWDERYFKSVYIYENNKTNPCYCYKFVCNGKTAVKLYKPLSTNKRFKWETNSSDCNIQGYDQLNKDGDLLIVASSMKDLLILVANGYNAIAPQGETMDIPMELTKELKSRFKRIVFCYDRDNAGLKWSKKYADIHECDQVILPKLDFDKEDKLKDFAEYYEAFHNRDKLLKFKALLHKLFYI